MVHGQGQLATGAHPGYAMISQPAAGGALVGGGTMVGNGALVGSGLEGYARLGTSFLQYTSAAPAMPGIPAAVMTSQAVQAEQQSSNKDTLQSHTAPSASVRSSPAPTEQSATVCILMASSI